MKHIFKSKKLYSLIFALFILISGVFSPLVISLTQKGAPVVVHQNIVSAENENAVPPEGENGPEINGCETMLDGSVLACFARFTYAIASLFGRVTTFTAKTLDLVLGLTISSAMYTSPFIDSGWVILRNLSNMAFIFILLYLAIQIILGVGQNVKKSLVTIILVALLINFSLFFSKVIVDSGNIVGRAFFNQTMESAGSNTAEGAALSPTVLVTNLIKVTRLFDPEIWKDIPPTNGQFDGTFAGSGVVYGAIGGAATAALTLFIVSNPAGWVVGTVLAAGTFIGGSIGYGIGSSVADAYGGPNMLALIQSLFVLILNGFMLWIFFKIILLLFLRIVKLWLLMVVSPLAFITKVVPGLSKIPYIGFDEWSKELLGSAFMPAIFYFFLYLIIKFLQPNMLFGSIPSDAPGLAADFKIVAGVFMPFVFVMLILKIAVDISVKVSGKGAESAINFGNKMLGMAGGLALGTAALTVGGIGRGVGGGLQRIANSDSAQNHKEHEDYTKKHAAWVAAGSIGTAPTAPTTAKNKGFNKVIGSWGAKMNERQQKVDDKQHGLKDLNAKAKDMYNGQEFKNLGRTQKEKVKEKIIEENSEKLLNKQSRALYGVDYGKIKGATPADTRLMQTAVRTAATTEARTKVTKMEVDSKQKLGKEQLLTSARTGSWDVRNLSQVTSNEGLLAKMGAGLLSTTANYTRLMLKQGLGVDHGTGQKDFFKDLETTLKTAFTKGFQAFNVKIDLPKVDAPGKKDDHG